MLLKNVDKIMLGLQLLVVGESLAPSQGCKRLFLPIEMTLSSNIICTVLPVQVSDIDEDLAVQVEGEYI